MFLLRRVGTCGTEMSGKRGGSAVGKGLLLSPAIANSPIDRGSTMGMVGTSPLQRELSVFIDSGSDTNFIDAKLVRELQIMTEELPEHQVVRSLNHFILHRVTLRTRPFKPVIENHTEWVTCYVITSPSQPLILGIGWLQRHNPHINWRSGRIMGWDTSCLASCLQSVRGQSHPEMEGEFAPDLSKVPPEYHDLKEVFNKSRATSLLPHRPYDMAIELHPGSVPPRGRLYSISGPEREPS